jgi:hypothetical protein
VLSALKTGGEVKRVEHRAFGSNTGRVASPFDGRQTTNTNPHKAQHDGPYVDLMVLGYNAIQRLGLLKLRFFSSQAPIETLRISRARIFSIARQFFHLMSIPAVLRFEPGGRPIADSNPLR